MGPPWEILLDFVPPLCSKQCVSWMGKLSSKHTIQGPREEGEEEDCSSAFGRVG